MAAESACPRPTVRYGRGAIGARVGVLVVPYVVELDDHHPAIVAYQVVVRYCETAGVPAVDAFTYFKGRDAGSLWINAFDGHPNAAGHILLAHAVEDLVRQNGPGWGVER